METSIIAPDLKKKLLRFQQDEIDSAEIYSRIAAILPDANNASIMRRIADEEAKHAIRWESVTGKKLRPSAFKISLYVFFARFLGLTFAVKKLEKGEAEGQAGYRTVLDQFPDVQSIINEENRHENELISMIDEERLRYAGSVVLGLNDALVELTGALAGYSFAFQNTRMIAVTGLITGIAASFSMASSEYLSQRSDGDGSVSPIKSAVYTGIAYIITVTLLVLPFFLLSNYMIALAITLSIVIIIILAFNYYLCTAKDLPFRKHFVEMLVVSLGVAFLSFIVGVLVKQFLGVDA
jgi:VIT1/CCC1 family predicted Fe2+/Mn2+ transporter